MRRAAVFALLASGALLASCEQVVKLPDPAGDDTGAAIKRLLDAGDPSWGKFTAKKTPTECMPGTVNGVEVRSCKVCAVVSYGRDSSIASFMGGPPPAVVRREEFHITFKRGLSYDQPDVVPEKRAGGVWVAVIPPSPGQFMPPPISRKTLASREISYKDAGITAVSHLLGSEYLKDGEKLSQDQVRGWYINLTPQQLEAIAGPCA